MKPDLSEFSYGYALTEDLIRWARTPLSAAPVFPSLIEEGRTGGGYDVGLYFFGMPLFLQFKLSHYMKHHNATEFKLGLFKHPFYRFHLLSARHSDQHKMLIDLESRGHKVYYTAPAFHLASELNRIYVERKVVENSIFISPSEIGDLPDDKDHHISFQFCGGAYFLSDPVKIEILSGPSFSETILTELRRRLSEGYNIDDFITPLSNQMIEIIEEHFRQREFFRFDILNELSPIQRVSYLARMFFGCEMFVVQLKEPRAA